MPYNPGISYRGDQFLFQGISQAGNAVADELKRQRELRQQADMADAVMNHAQATGRITPEEYNNYLNAPLSKKVYMSHGVMANIADDLKRQQMAQAMQIHQQQLANALEVARIHANASRDVANINNAGGDDDPYIVPIYNDDGELVGHQNQKGQISYLPARVTAAQNAQHNPGDPVIDSTGKPTGQIYGPGDTIVNPPRQAAADPMKAYMAAVLSGQDPATVLAQPSAAPTPNKSPAPKGNAPQPGLIKSDPQTGLSYRFKGGDPADPNNWENVTPPQASTGVVY